VKTILNEVQKIINPVYAVGGVCRDFILGFEPKDYDFSTSLTPEEIENAIRKVGKKPYLVGKRFGTIGMKINGQLVEITTFRSEKYNDGSRKPEVQFVNDIIADLSRRDFTINAMAYREKLIDPFGCKEDLLNKIIKCVGHPSHRFNEDALRMLRACRFASQLGFIIEEKTFQAMKQLNYKILSVSKERWVMELDKILLTDKPSIGLNYLMDSRIMNFILPEISLQKNYDQNSQYHNLTLWEHTLSVVDNVPLDINLRWSAFLHDVAKPFVRTDKIVDDKLIKSNYIKHDLLGKEIVIKIAKYLKWSNDRTETVSNLVANHLNNDSPLREADNLGKIKNV
jgi:tRNA nucleotidyltransferase (CCA-adding enzyme)